MSDVVKIVGQDGIGPLAGINIRIAVDAAPIEAALDDRWTDTTGQTAFAFRPPSPSGRYMLYVNEWPGAVDARFGGTHVAVRFPLPDGFEIGLKRLIEPVQTIRIENDTFVDEQGTRWLWNMATNFLLPQRIAEGESIGPVLYPGVTGYRLFLTHYNIGMQFYGKPFHPSIYGEQRWLDAIEQTGHILTANGKYRQGVLICDNQIFGKDVAYITNLQNKVTEIMRAQKGWFYSLANENPKNGINADNFSKPQGVIAATGSGLGGGPAPLSNGKAWDIQHQHLRRDEKMFVDIHPVDAPSYDLNHMIIMDEPIGFADFNSSARTNRLDWAYQLGAFGRALWGMTAHLNNGVHSKPLGAREGECLAAFVRGMTGQDF